VEGFALAPLQRLLARDQGLKPSVEQSGDLDFEDRRVLVEK